MINRKIKIVLFSMLIINSLMAQKTPLVNNWQFSEYKKNDWREAKIPGEVHTDLLNHKLINDPFQYSNDKGVQWVGFKDWEYKTSFDVEHSTLDKQRVELVFPGLDTYADVYLNGYLILEADNMFRTWRVDAKKYLKEKGNQLYIHFKSIYNVDMPKYLEAPFQLQAWPNNDQSDIWLSLYARKAGYHYGWDWGPRLITCGIWREAYIDAWDTNRIVGVQITTKSLNDKKAQMRAILETESLEDQLNLKLFVENVNGVSVSKVVNLKKGANTFNIDFEVKNPKLWWSNGLGEAHLYTFNCRLDNGKEIKTEQVTTGIRTIEVVKEKDKDGQSLYVRLNGKNVFMKGANYIPLDNFVSRVTDQHYEYTIKSAADANMNMLRVWGGGIYENDIFYDLCDKYGILVWQDMMFACGMFPADEYYLNNVSKEVIDNVRRLRNHPSIALWNGNNENEISYFEWGWKNRLTSEADKIYQSNLKKLFYDIIPSAIEEVDASRYYHPTSPTAGYNNIGYNMGDVHSWSVWKGGDVEDYLTNVGRFMSEYGFQAYPDMFTIKKFTSKWDWYLGSPVMLSHQRARNDETRDPHYGDKMMIQYMDKYFTTPSDFEDFMYMSQFQQAEIVKIGIESHRRKKPYCMGTLYWQINDCWPVASWSSMDYYGRWKALHYYTKKAYSEVLVSPYKENDKVKVKVISDRESVLKANLSIKSMNFDGGVLFEKTIPITVEANGCLDVFESSVSELFANNVSDGAFIVAVLMEGNKELSSNIFFTEYANKYKYNKPDPKIEVIAIGGGYKVRIESQTLIRGMYLFTENEKDFFMDNYINILPNAPIEIEVKSESKKNDFVSQLKYKAYNEVRNEKK